MAQDSHTGAPRSTGSREAEASSARPARQEIGRRGEDAAVAHLIDAGFVVLERNWRCRWGEIDVLAADGDALAVVEVKTRTGALYGDPAQAVTPAKLARMRRLAGLWLAAQDRRWAVVRFDVVAVRLDLRSDACAVTHLRGVF